MRLAAGAAGPCAVFGGGEVNVSQNDGSGLVDVLCWSEPGPGPGGQTDQCGVPGPTLESERGGWTLVPARGSLRSGLLLVLQSSSG